MSEPCRAVNLNGERCQLERGHAGWHEADCDDGRRQSTWNFLAPTALPEEVLIARKMLLHAHHESERL